MGSALARHSRSDGNGQPPRPAAICNTAVERTWRIKDSQAPRRARIQGSHTLVSCNSRLESDKDEEEEAQYLGAIALRGDGGVECREVVQRDGVRCIDNERPFEHLFRARCCSHPTSARLKPRFWRQLNPVIPYHLAVLQTRLVQGFGGRSGGLGRSSVSAPSSSLCAEGSYVRLIRFCITHLQARE